MRIILIKKIFPYIVLLLGMLPLTARSQSLLDFPSLNAASLGQYGQVEVNPIVYVRLEKEEVDMVVLDGSEQEDQMIYEMRGNLKAYFYWDEAKTKPINVTELALDLILQMDPRAEFYPPLSNPFIVRGEYINKVLLSNVHLREVFAERDFDTATPSVSTIILKTW